jgi:carbonic anhydrase
MCELNVIEQVVNVCQTTVVRDVWQRGQALTVHGWIYGIHDGLLRDLHIKPEHPDEVSTRYASCLAALS